MPRTTYGKLVRDRIPEIIRASGRECGIEEISEEEVRSALLVKLVEEAEEARAVDADLVTECADVLEVLEAAITVHGLTWEAVRAEQQRRRAERGGFEKRLRLLWTQ